ncbi:hypothetical protein CYFUS_007869 [Cystobacter fuscus]|uniref:Uncharacterized protein n=2 Tax=Cystobacter fuscus TaxID=43 RepID=A0A250JG52_9BACT|nr:hypothetical protein CYFUS_007869 [Cystobacter fuscus]
MVEARGGSTPELERTVVARGSRSSVPVRPPSRGEVEPGSSASLPLEGLALVALVWGRDRAAELFEGLKESDAVRARGYLAGFAALSSARRQARVAVEFGVRLDAAARLRGVMEQAPEALRREIFRRLPPYHRSLFPSLQLEPSGPEATERVCALAERLIREATR